MRISGRRRAHRLGLVLALGLVALPLAGCATKKDMALLRGEILAMQARQDSIYRELNQEVMDTLRANNVLLVRVRGDLAGQLLAMEEQLIQIQELAGLGQREIHALREQWQTRTEFQDRRAGDTEVAQISEEEVEETYRLGREKFEEGSFTTARTAFASILASAPGHELAPEAQLQIAETYAAEEDYESAYEAFEKVIELFANSSSAPTALYRAGLVAKEEGNNERARMYFTRVQSGYPRSDEAKLASEELQRLRSRR